MKNYLTSILLLTLVSQVSYATYFEQLCQFNPNWKKYSQTVCNQEALRFQSDKEYIQAHLESVLDILKSNPISHLNPDQIESRMHLIELLKNYRKAGNFPANYYQEKRIPVFIDEHATHCAVGYLLQQTGFGEVAQEIALTNNYAWLKDIDHSQFPDWQKASGFSLDELKLIQGAYDYYTPNALMLANRYEVPQKPEVMTIYFSNLAPSNDKSTFARKENVWISGEGKDGILNGRWEQNSAPGVPWIEGFYKNGKRTGQWKEYYHGTNKLCRTEVWENDELNGTRKRFDRNGVLIEEIVFVDGDAILKTNYDFKDSLVQVRTPYQDTLMWTETFTLKGALVARGYEKVHNPGNLLWFQNIELTALNSASITSRQVVQGTQISLGNQIRVGQLNQLGQLPVAQRNLSYSPPLVEYLKVGEWEYFEADEMTTSSKLLKEFFIDVFEKDFSTELQKVVMSFEVFINEDTLLNNNPLGINFELDDFKMEKEFILSGKR